MNLLCVDTWELKIRTRDDDSSEQAHATAFPVTYPEVVVSDAAEAQ